MMLATGTLALVLAAAPVPSADQPTAEMLTVLEAPPEPGPRITPYLRYQLARAWSQDDRPLSYDNWAKTR